MGANIMLFVPKLGSENTYLPWVLPAQAYHELEILEKVLEADI